MKDDLSAHRVLGTLKQMTPGPATTLATPDDFKSLPRRYLSEAVALSQRALKVTRTKRDALREIKRVARSSRISGFDYHLSRLIRDGV